MARNFNGSSDYIKVAAAVLQQYPVTIAAWFYPTQNTATTFITIVQDGAASQFLALEYRAGDASKPVSGAFNDTLANYLQADTTASPTINTWNHGCAVLYPGGASAAAFLNGGNKGTSSAAAVNQNTGHTEIIIGGYDANGTIPSFPFQGRIADVAIWNVALSDAEVRLLGSGVLRPPQVRPEALVAYWPLEEAAATALSVSTKFGWVGKPTGTSLASGPPILARFVPLITPKRVVAAGSSGAGSAAGSASVSGIGASTARSTASSAGTGAASGVGAATDAATASSAGTGTASGVGLATITAAGSSAGTGAASGVGVATDAATASSTGVGTAAAASTSTAASAASASGVGAALSIAASRGAVLVFSRVVGVYGPRFYGTDLDVGVTTLEEGQNTFQKSTGDTAWHDPLGNVVPDALVAALAPSWTVD